MPGCTPTITAWHWKPWLRMVQKIWYLIQEFDREVVEEEEEEERSGELSESSPVTSSPDLMEFERYLYFYKQTVGLLIQNGVVSPEQVTLPIVSTAISHLWQELPEDKRESILLACAQIQSDCEDAEAACAEPPSAAEDSVKDSGLGSQEASGSLVSTPEEILFEDAFDVATSVSSPSSEFAGCSAENPEENDHLYVQIISFLKGLFYGHTQLPQKTIILLDEEAVMLRCTETFEDEDL